MLEHTRVWSALSVYICLPVSKWRYEVEAAVHPVVHYVSSVQPALIMKVSFKLVVNVLNDGLKAEVINQTETGINTYTNP